MAEEETSVQADEKPEDIDYKSLYEETLAQSRKWEKFAKENLKFKETAQAEKERADRLELEKDRASWVASVSKETGVPSDVLANFSCETADDLKAKAEAIAGHFKRDALPVVPGDGSRPEDVKGSAMQDFVHQLLHSGE